MKISACISYVVLGGVNVYCMKVLGGEDVKRFPVGTYGSYIINSLFGILYNAIDDIQSNIEKPFNFTKVLKIAIPLPFIACEAWLVNGYRKEYAYAHAVFGVIPIIQWLAGNEKKEFVDLLVAVEAISLGYVSFMAENYLGVAAACMYVFNYFFKDKAEDILGLPTEEVGNYGEAVYAFLSLYAIGRKA